MDGNPIDRYRRLFDYKRDAHDKMLASFETVPAEGRQTPEFRRAVALMAHLVEARKVWLGRLGVIPAVSGTLFPDEADVGRVAEEWREKSKQKPRVKGWGWPDDPAASTGEFEENLPITHPLVTLTQRRQAHHGLSIGTIQRIPEPFRCLVVVLHIASVGGRKMGLKNTRL